jgi:hypothetical protein
MGASAVAVAAGSLGLAGCSPEGEDKSELETIVAQTAQDAPVATLNVAEDQVVAASDFEEAPYTNYLVLEKTFDLPINTLIFQDSPRFLATLMPGAQGEALTKMGFFDLEAGAMTVVMEQALAHDEDYVLYDVRANDTTIIWVECNLATANWRVHLAPVTQYGTNAAAPLGTAHLVDEGGIDYEPPQLCVSGTKAYWTVMPDPNGPASQEDSYFKAAAVLSTGDAVAEVETVCVSHGRMITNPRATQGIVTVVPRVDIDGIYYQITALDESSNAVVAVDILPQSMRVIEAVYMGGSFSFCTEDNYEYAEGLQFYGTYRELASGSYLHVNRMPTVAPVLMGDILIVKSTKSVVGIDAQAQRFFAIDTLADCATYGDVLAACGVQDKVVTYTTVTPREGGGAGTTKVRVFAKATSAEAGVEAGAETDGETGES